jgi:hypothetical protein
MNRGVPGKSNTSSQSAHELDCNALQIEWSGIAADNSRRDQAVTLNDSSATSIHMGVRRRHGNGQWLVNCKGPSRNHFKQSPAQGNVPGDGGHVLHGAMPKELADTGGRMASPAATIRSSPSRRGEIA